jgi:hypothetical protein
MQNVKSMTKELKKDGKAPNLQLKNLKTAVDIKKKFNLLRKQTLSLVI